MLKETQVQIEEASGGMECLEGFWMQIRDDKEDEKRKETLAQYRIKVHAMKSPAAMPRGFYRSIYFACSRASVTVVMSHTSVGP